MKAKKTSSPHLRPLASSIALALLGMGLAQAQDAGKKVEVETVVVTANKRAQNLQDVPAAITVLSDAELQRNNVRDINDLPNLSPALTITYSTQPANFSVNMRGIGTFSLGVGVESDVAVVIDDVPFALQANAFKDLADVFRVEVLKGPQSTLLGKSSIAGALNITTKPIDGVWHERFNTLMTSDNEWRVGGSVSGPVSDTLRMRVAASKSGFPGLVKNLTDGGMLNGSRSETLAAKFEWAPLNDLQVTFSPRYNRSVVNCCVQPYTAMTPGGLYQNIAQLPASTLLAGITPSADNVSVRNDFPAGGKTHDGGAGLKVNYAFDDNSILAGHALTSITSFSTYHMDDYQDGDGTDANVLRYVPGVDGKLTGFTGGLYLFGNFDVKSRTQELRLTSPDKGAFRYVAGLWYGDNKLSRELTRAPISSYTTAYSTVARNTSYAVFGQSTWDFRPDTSLIAGLRLNREDTGYDFTRYAPPPAAKVATETYAKTDSNKDVTGKLGLEHRLEGGTMAYATVSTGHKGVAYDLTSSFNAAVAAQQPVAAETAKSYEAGLKMSLLDNRMLLNLAVFRTDFKGFQQSAGFTDALGIFRTTLHSIGGLRTSGFEADLNWRVQRELTLNGAFAYTNAIITSFENGPCYSVLNAAGTGTVVGGNCAPNPKYNNTNVANLAGATLPNAPKVKANLGGQYDIILPSSNFNAFVTGAYRWQSKTQFNLNQDPMTIQDAFGIANVGFGIRDKKDQFKFTLFVNNLFDKRYAAGLANGLANGTWSSKAPNPVVVVNTFSWTPPRDYTRYFGMRLDMNF
ncbi:MAG: TonB-dependent receptor [Pseudomonadota bacterium]